MLIEEYLTYLTAVRRFSRNTVRLREVYIRQLADDLDLRHATPVQLQTWLARHDEWSTATVNAATATMRSFFEWAVESGILSVNPARKLTRLTVPPRKPNIATTEQIAAGLASDDAYVRAFTRLGAECGLRVHEIAKLHTSDRHDDWLTIVGKGGRTRVVHVQLELAAELDALEAAQGAGHYFRSPTRPHLTAESVRQRITRATGTNPHSFRHRAGTTVYRRTGNDIRLTQVFLGHSNSRTTEIYVHVERDDLIAASAAARIAA